MTVAQSRLRPARFDEGSDLTESALCAKSHWGYDVGFLGSARADLTIDEDVIRSSTIYVLDAIRRAREAGFEELLIESDRFAEPFYLAMGAERMGAIPSPVDGAPLPLPRVRVAL
jgi:hypothetical protein